MNYKLINSESTKKMFEFKTQRLYFFAKNTRKKYMHESTVNNVKQICKNGIIVMIYKLLFNNL